MERNKYLLHQKQCNFIRVRLFCMFLPHFVLLQFLVFMIRIMIPNFISCCFKNTFLYRMFRVKALSSLICEYSKWWSCNKSYAKRRAWHYFQDGAVLVVPETVTAFLGNIWCLCQITITTKTTNGNCFKRFMETRTYGRNTLNKAYTKNFLAGCNIIAYSTVICITR